MYDEYVCQLLARSDRQSQMLNISKPWIGSQCSKLVPGDRSVVVVSAEFPLILAFYYSIRLKKIVSIALSKRVLSTTFIGSCENFNYSHKNIYIDCKNTYTIYLLIIKRACVENDVLIVC